MSKSGRLFRFAGNRTEQATLPFSRRRSEPGEQGLLYASNLFSHFREPPLDRADRNHFWNPRQAEQIASAVPGAERLDEGLLVVDAFLREDALAGGALAADLDERVKDGRRRLVRDRRREGAGLQSAEPEQDRHRGLERARHIVAYRLGRLACHLCHLLRELHLRQSRERRRQGAGLRIRQ